MKEPSESKKVFWDSPEWEQDFSLLIIRVAHEIVQHEDSSLGEYGLTYAKSNIIAFLSHNQHRTINQTAIAAQFGVKPSSVTSILTSMEKQDLVTRTKHPKDSRNNVIALTRKGLDLDAILRSQVRSLEDKMLKGVDLEERRALMASLVKLLVNSEAALTIKAGSAGLDGVVDN